MTTKTTFIAIDGKEFENESECYQYESQLESIKYKDTALFFSDKGEVMSLTEDGYLTCTILLCKTDAAAEFIHKRFRTCETPWGEYYSHKAHAGCWVYLENQWISANKYLEFASILEKIMKT